MKLVMIFFAASQFHCFLGLITQTVIHKRKLHGLKFPSPQRYLLFKSIFLQVFRAFFFPPARYVGNYKSFHRHPKI